MLHKKGYFNNKMQQSPPTIRYDPSKIIDVATVVKEKCCQTHKTTSQIKKNKLTNINTAILRHHIQGAP